MSLCPPQSLLRKLRLEDIANLSDNLMQALLVMLSTASGQTGGVQEDALLTIAVVVECKYSSSY